MASQGQRFRRRALRRGYKVDEVDSFLDRVEATLAGDPVGAPVVAQAVHDIVFRVRFGGYDEWQVDLHLDRVERQLAELEERAASFQTRGGDPRADPRSMDPRQAGPRLKDQRPAEPRPAEPRGQRPAEPRMAPPAPAERGLMPPPPHDDRLSGPIPSRQAPVPTPPATNAYPRYDEPTTYGGGGYSGGSYPGAGSEPGRHGKSDMTTELRMPGNLGGGRPSLGDVDAARVDQLRRTFQVRRFGSGYDRNQVDRLFAGIVDAMGNRTPVPVGANELDPAQFSLVPGGYFEAEVDAALREVRDMLGRRR